MKKSNLDIAMVQCDLVWENPAASRAHIDTLLLTMNEQADVVVLPEMFTTGFSMDFATQAEEHSDEMPSLLWMKEWSKKLNALLMGSIAVRDQGKSWNRLYAVKPSGEVQTYDKRHTFRFASEHLHFEPGVERALIEWQGWKIAPFICYDLRFPVWSRNQMRGVSLAYDAMVYVANWPAVRSQAWGKLLLARAIENQAYVIACNRMGQDGKGLEYSGDSVVIDFRGEEMTRPCPNEECIIRSSISADALEDFRTKFPAWMDADDFVAPWRPLP
ncbi:MAG: amidohydrolase [Flavobacteriales bacterium]